MGTLKTSQLAKKAQVNAETLRYYIRRGLIEEPSRSSSGYREYPEETARRIRFIKNGQALGFTLQEIKELLDFKMTSKTACKKIKKAVNQKIEGVKQKISSLQRILHTLEQMESMCVMNKTKAGCLILESLEQEDK